MTQIKFQTLFVWFLVGLILGASFTQFMVTSGEAFPASVTSLLITLPASALASYLLTIPVARYRKKLQKFNDGSAKERPGRVNPFYAFRVLVLSRAVTITGAGFAGWHAGQLLWLLAFSVPSGGTAIPTALGMLGGLAMTIAGILGEANCRTPKDPDESASA